MSDEVEVVLREFVPHQDQALVFASWRNGAYYGSGMNPGSAVRFFKKQTIKIKDILKGAMVKVACIKDTPEVIIGYSVTTKDHLNWIYVKDGFRNKGIGTLLLPKDLKTVSDKPTKLGQILIHKKNLKTKGD